MILNVGVFGLYGLIEFEFFKEMMVVFRVFEDCYICFIEDIVWVDLIDVFAC